MLVLGLMSGTSADGIDVALVRIEGAPPVLKIRFESHYHASFGAPLRETILRVAEGDGTTAAELSQLNVALGKEFAEAAIRACKKARVPLSRVQLIGSHGQTIYHQPAGTRFLGINGVASTLQIGEPSVIAMRTGIPTVADFRPMDLAAGGQGAPLVPFVDYALYRSNHVGRVALNIGGIANVTVIPARAKPDDVMAFDTGPGNMIIDALVATMTGGRQRYDRDAKIARSGKTLPELLDRLLGDPYFAKKPPKTTGREHFGKSYAERMFAWSKEHGVKPEDLVRTATVFTALSIADAFKRFILPRTRIHELIAAGGGTRNPLIMEQLAAALPGIDIFPSGHFGVPEEAKEALAFAVLAYEAWHGRPNNLRTATGARRAVVMGKIVSPFGTLKHRRKVTG